MAQSFHITPAANFATLDATGTGRVAFTVTNASTKPLRAYPEIKPLGSTQREWLEVEGQAERAFSGNEAQVFTVIVKVPSGSTAGKYEFKLNMISADRADTEGSTEGPAVQFKVEEVAPPPPPPKWLWIAAAVLVLLIGGATALVIKSKLKPLVMPAVEGKLLADVEDDLQKKGVHIVVTGRITQTGTNPAGHIWQQDPKASEPLTPNQNVTLIVESASVEVPSFAGDKLAQALTKSSPKNLFLNTPQIRVDPANVDKIVDQSPKHPTRVAEGTHIDLWVGVPTPTTKPGFHEILATQVSEKALSQAVQVRQFGKARTKAVGP